MPGPGHKKKAKATPQTQPATPTASRSSTPTDAYIGEIDRAETWTAIVDILCRVFEVPDMTRRSGLKKVHLDFENIYRRLDAAYTKFQDNLKIAGGIVGIYAKMCADSILRDKLIAKGLLDKLFPLLDEDSTRYMALRALNTITSHGGVPVRLQIAKETSKLTALLERYPDDDRLVELVIAVMGHSVTAVLDRDELSDPAAAAVFKVLDMGSIVKLVTESVRKEWASAPLIGHGIGLLSVATLHGHKACKAYLPMQKLLVAGLRSKDWVLRCICLGGMNRLFRNGSEPDMPPLNPHTFITNVTRGFPRHLGERMEAYGPPRCDTYLIFSASRDFQQAMLTFAQDHNLYSLGLKLADCILRTEFSISEGRFQSAELGGKSEAANVGLPFTLYSDALPHCARAIRNKGNPNEADLADILDLKFHIMRQNIPQAIAHAYNALKRNPNCAYFYYVITLSANRTEGLRAAKKGLKCKWVPPFVRFQMLQRAVEHAGDMGICTLQECPAAGKAKWEEGIAFLMSALEDAKLFVDQAPPDNRHMNAVLYWYILLTIAIQGPELSTDLRELEHAMAASKIADEFSIFIGAAPPRTNLRLSQQGVVKLYPIAAAEFGHIITKLEEADQDSIIAPPSRTKLEDDLAAWLEDGHICDRDHDDDLHGLHPRISTNSVMLYRCSWCGNPSAVLRKCSGCSQTRYCDSACQKQHWTEHKRHCKPSV